MIYGSVCSGIESATVAWHPLGWRAAFYAEIEAFPSAVLAHHYPEVQNLGDVTRFSQWPDATLDVLVGGTPCQSFSVAGLRAGLDDPRGNLMLTYLAIAERYRPDWLVWENVPGVLSSGGGRDFGVFLWALGKLGYGWAYRVLDAQYFNLAQRRARVFVVASVRGWTSAAAVLFERASLSGNPAPRRETKEDIAGTVTGGARKRGGFSHDDVEMIPSHDPACTLTAREYKGALPEADLSTVVTHALRADGFDATEDGTGRGTPIVPLCFDETQITNPDNRSNPQPGDPSHPLAAGARSPTIAFDCKASGRNGFAIGVSPTLRAMEHKDTHSNAGGQVAVAYGMRSDAAREGSARTPSADAEGRVRLRDPWFNVYEELSPTLDAGAAHSVGTQYAVRRLTPRECERLQGFPDDYTLIPYRGKPAADGPRYKALGNSKAVPVVRWIGGRIELVERLLQAVA